MKIGLSREAVAEAANGLDQMGGKPVAELRAKTFDMRFDDVGMSVEINIPNELRYQLL